MAEPTVTFLRAKPPRCRAGFHAWTVWHIHDAYRRWEPAGDWERAHLDEEALGVLSREGIIAIRACQDRRCLECASIQRREGPERRVPVEWAEMVGLQPRDVPTQRTGAPERAEHRAQGGAAPQAGRPPSFARAASVFSMMRAARAAEDSRVSRGPRGRPVGALSP